MIGEEANPALVAIRTQRGLAAKLGRHLGISRAAVAMWETVPPKHGPRVAKFLKLPLHAVCPEIFPAPVKVRSRMVSTKN